jgi:hypothetical protein
MIFGNTCCDVGGGRHNFQPRYTERENNNFAPTSLRGGDMEALRKLYIIDIYVYDICTWCGKIIKGDKP